MPHILAASIKNETSVFSNDGKSAGNAALKFTVET
jgi:hypothetical protein